MQHSPHLEHAVGLLLDLGVGCKITAKTF